ncbi:MAG: DivIVA domain-containing protein, partial [Actinoplanes sp.]
MPLTPADIHHTEFGKAGLGRRGYDEEQVDALLDEVSQEMSELLEERQILQQQISEPGP